jgi:hypothetical protein
MPTMSVRVVFEAVTASTMRASMSASCLSIWRKSVTSSRASCLRCTATTPSGAHALQQPAGLVRRQMQRSATWP